LSPVTEKIDSGAHVLIFDRLELIHNINFINLGDYADFFNQEMPIKIMQGGSTFCAIKKNMRNHENKIGFNQRRIIAAGRKHRLTETQINDLTGGLVELANSIESNGSL
jgi:hypothetical protein